MTLDSVKSRSHRSFRESRCSKLSKVLGTVNPGCLWGCCSLYFASVFLTPRAESWIPDHETVNSFVLSLHSLDSRWGSKLGLTVDVGTGKVDVGSLPTGEMYKTLLYASPSSYQKRSSSDIKDQHKDRHGKSDIMVLISLVSLLTLVPTVLGHGYMTRPKSRTRLGSEVRLSIPSTTVTSH